MVGQGERMAGTNAASLGGLEEGLAFLLLFSDALLDLVPDPIAVLDPALVVRNANRAFAAAFGFASVEATRGASVADLPLMVSAAGADAPAGVGDVLRRLFERNDLSWEAEHLEVQAPGDEPRDWWVRAVAWDTEDPSYRRILFYAREQDPATDPAVVAAAAAVEPQIPAPPVSPAPPAPSRAAPETPRAAEIARELLENLPHAAFIVDAQSRVEFVNRRCVELLGRAGAKDFLGIHWLRALPEFGNGELRGLLDAARESGTRVAGTVEVARTSGGHLAVEIEVQPLRNPDDEVTELLVLFHEVEPMMPSIEVSEAKAAIPETTAAILDPERVARWPVPSTNRILVVEVDPWTRMSLSESLRAAGLDVALCDSGSLAWERHDPAFFAVVVAGLDSDPDDITQFLRRMAREAPAVPVLGVTERSHDRVRHLAAGLPIAGILTGSPKNPEISNVAGFFAHRGPNAPVAAERPAPASESSDAMLAAMAEPLAAAPPPASFEPPPVSGIAVVVVGAGEADVSAIRMLHSTPGIRVRMVYDPDSLALGLSVARELGIPTLAGGATLSLDPLPDAVVVARSGLESALAGLGLSSLPRVAREEVALFASDPEPFLTPVAETAPPIANEPEPPPLDLSPRLEFSPPQEVAAPIQEFSPPQEFAPLDPPTPALDAPPPAAPVSSPASEPNAYVPPAPEPPAAPARPIPAAAAPAPRTYSQITPPPPRQARVTSIPDAWAVAGAPPPASPSAAGPSLVEELTALTGAFDLLFDFDRLCKRVLDLGMAEAGAMSGSLMLLDEEGRYLRIVAAVGLSDLVVHETRQRLGQGIAGRVADEGEPLLLVGAIGDERFPVQGERPEIPSAICVPLESDGRVLGVLSVNSNPAGEPFDQPELRRLTALGRQVGPAVDRAGQLRLVRGRSFEMSLRGAIASIATSSDDIVTRLRRVAIRVTELLHVDTCAIWLHEPGTQRLSLRAIGGATATTLDGLSLPVGTGIVGWVAKHRRPLLVRGNPDDPMDRDVVQVASVAVPIRHQTDLVGVLALESTSETALDEKRLALIMTVAAVVGEQIGTSRAQASSDRMVTMLSALAELGVAFSAARERPNLGRLVAFTATTVLESDVATVRLLRDAPPPGAIEIDLFDVVAVHGAQAETDDPLMQLENLVAREILARGGAVTQADLPEREGAALLTRSNIASLLGVPLLSDDGDVLGNVIAYRVPAPQERDYNYGAQEREIAARLGDYASSAAQRLLRGPRGPESGAE